MRIAQIAPLAERVPPKQYGGTERVVYALTEELVRRGHDVTLFATGDSNTSGKLHPVFPRPLREARIPDPYGVNHATLLNIGEAYGMHGEFDVIHDHVSPISLPVANIVATPVVMTVHGPFTPENRRLYNRMNRPVVVTISKSQLYRPNGINHAGVIYNGLAMEKYPFDAEPEDYLLFVGRISPEKGVHFAMEVAQSLDMRLIIAAKLDAQDEDYFRVLVKPRLSSRIEWIGEVGEEQRNELMSKARCFLHPVMWREPFGLTLIEAAACGCPVVAFNRGSIPEVVEDGVTGYVVADVDEMIGAVENIDGIDRATCRARVLLRFNAERMTDEYEDLYRKIFNQNRLHAQEGA